MSLVINYEEFCVHIEVLYFYNDSFFWTISRNAWCVTLSCEIKLVSLCTLNWPVVNVLLFVNVLLVKQVKLSFFEKVFTVTSEFEVHIY